MVKIADYFTQAAHAAEAELGALAVRAERQELEGKRFRALESAIERGLDDGRLDDAEADRILSLLEQNGLDPSAAAELVAKVAAGGGDLTGAAGIELRAHLRSVLSGEREKISETESLFSLEVQQGLSAYQLAVKAASTAKKIEHDAYMVAINNLKA